MKHIVYLMILPALFFCCTNRGIDLSRGESIFISKLRSKKPGLGTGTQLIFITNKSACGPCEEQVQLFYAEHFGGCPKTFVVSPDQQYGNQWKDTLQFSYRELASYGLMRVSGAVLILQDGDCLLLESIDITHPEKLKARISEVLKRGSTPPAGAPSPPPN